MLQFLRDDNVDDVADLRLHSLVLSVHELLDALHLLVQLFLRHVELVLDVLPLGLFEEVAPHPVLQFCDGELVHFDTEKLVEASDHLIHLAVFLHEIVKSCP